MVTCSKAAEEEEFRRPDGWAGRGVVDGKKAVPPPNAGDRGEREEAALSCGFCCAPAVVLLILLWIGWS
jgi:hypothetical protein